MTLSQRWRKGNCYIHFILYIYILFNIYILYNYRGVGAMEIVAMDMKLRGMYIARQLSFHGVSFRIDEVPLSKEFCKIYDEAVELVRRII